MEAEKYKTKKWIVSAGNIGNVEFLRYNEALVDYNTYVQDSKDGYGRVGQENVYLLLDGEPVQEFIWRDWRIAEQKTYVVECRTNFEKALIVLNRFLERQDNED